MYSFHSIYRIIFIVMLCISNNASFAQSQKEITGISGNYWKFTPRLKNKIHGDSLKAPLASKTKDYNGELVAQLGYINSDSATEEEVRNNLEIGLLIFPLNSHEIASYCLTVREVKMDPIGPLCVEGNKINSRIFDMIYFSIKPETKLEFTNIRMRGRSSEITMPLPNFWIKVR